MRDSLRKSIVCTVWMFDRHLLHNVSLRRSFPQVSDAGRSGPSECLICFDLMDVVIRGIFLTVLTARKLRAQLMITAQDLVVYIYF